MWLVNSSEDIKIPAADNLCTSFSQLQELIQQPGGLELQRPLPCFSVDVEIKTIFR